MEKPIIFSGEMVKAILDGRKTQTRRVMKPQLKKLDYKDESLICSWDRDKSDKGMIACSVGPFNSKDEAYTYFVEVHAPYQKGDKLWVREAFCPDWCEHVVYKADGGSAVAAGYDAEPRWKPSIHMHHSDSRITLLVKNVRVERLQDISRDSAIKEGVRWENCPLEQTIADVEYSKTRMCSRQTVDYRSGFRKLWNSIYAKKGHGWDVNPWVWVIEFERCE
jgi:hypothetical protein